MTSFLTLDGVTQAPGGPAEDTTDDFRCGGWLVPFHDEVMGEVVSRWFGAADAFVLGRRTYDIFAASWPRSTDPDDPIAAALNTLPKYVASRTRPRLAWSGSTLIEGDAAEGVAALKRLPGRELQVHGSTALAQTLLRHGLVDELRLLTFPVVLGSGRRLFADGTVPAALRLTAPPAVTGTGAVITTYEPAGQPSYGTMEVD
ncbi:dihydrofolate reductase family protein [Streptomyces sp. SL13]|uniref:Dihydrofolate reductase family protein n=1 Tax=Streptantibioticus silvisoli TaxID=2705255 RepID=A0AA90K7S8_9ACTN|nr:dihydrofolate reductase family protein [Streptantibioticus silvisoli]MDI5969238.1 dihydrofolate reductase family protein [Streptantibioticus silvisoli]